MAKTIVGKFLKKAGNFAKSTAGIVLPVAGALAAVAIPGVGSAVGGAISGLANKVLGRSGESDPLAGVSAAVASSVAPKPETSGGLFGKGGLLGTGLFAGREWTEYNKTLKWAKKDSKMLEEASKILGINVTSLDELKRHFGPQEMEELEALAVTKLVNSGETPPGTMPNKSDGPNWLYIAGGALAAKLLGVF